MERLIDALHKTIKLQLELIEKLQKKTNNEKLKEKIYEYQKITSEMQEMLPKERKVEYPSRIEFDGNDLRLIQKAKGGEYILWGCDTSCGTQCGAAYIPEGFDTEWFDLFLAETKNEQLTEDPENKDIDLYTFGNPFQDDYEYHKKIDYNDIIEVAEACKEEPNNNK